MTDPAPSPPAGQPPVPNRPMPTLGRGVVWSAHPYFEGVVPPAEPYTPKPRPRPAGWPKTGNVGTKGPLTAADRAAVTVPARPYEDELPTPSLGATGSSLGVAMHTCADHCQCDEARCGSCADSGHVCENHPDRPWAGVSDDINACHCGGAGMPCPECCDPVPQDGTGSIGDAFTPRKFRCPAVDLNQVGRDSGPPAVELLAMADDLNAHGGLDERFVAGLLKQVTVDDAPESRLSQWLMGEFVAHVNDGVDKAAVLDAMVAAANQPSEHQHIWTTTSPMRCVECRRYLRPWWRRALDRVRRGR